MNGKETDAPLRLSALDLALRAQQRDDTPDAIVARAEAFLRFLDPPAAVPPPQGATE